jgi:hypothetical protein
LRNDLIVLILGDLASSQPSGSQSTVGTSIALYLRAVSVFSITGSAQLIT